MPNLVYIYIYIYIENPCYVFNAKSSLYIYSTLVGYLMENPVYIYIYIYIYIYSTLVGYLMLNPVYIYIYIYIYLTLVGYLMPNPVYIYTHIFNPCYVFNAKSCYIRGLLNKFPDFFRMGTFFDSTHMKL